MITIAKPTACIVLIVAPKIEIARISVTAGYVLESALTIPTGPLLRALKKNAAAKAINNPASALHTIPATSIGIETRINNK
jgi:hypothetical protein